MSCEDIGVLDEKSIEKMKYEMTSREVLQLFDPGFRLLVFVNENIRQIDDRLLSDS